MRIENNSPEVHPFQVQKANNKDKEQQQPINNNQTSEDKKSLMNQEDINNALNKLNDTLETYNQHLRFKYFEDAERMMVQVVDMPTQEVIKEIPPEEILEMVSRIKEMVGVILDETI